jgi:hypothetical protein
MNTLLAQETKNSKITILDQISLKYSKRGDVPFSEISDITYDEKSKELFMIGDKGYLYKFSANFDRKIKNLKYINGFKLLNSKRKRKRFDSEGLTYNRRGELIVSFERKPKIAKISKKGIISPKYRLPRKLRKKSAYRSKNKMFEALAYHPKYGILTVAEYPLRRYKKNYQTIYSLKGKEWHFKTERYKNSAVTAIEVMDDNNILVLERAYSGLSYPLMITLKKVYINKCDKRRRCKSEVLISFDSFKGWGMENFEGLARVGKNRFLMVSDNNNEDFLPTTLVYFKVK